MTPNHALLLLIPVAYLCGSIPFGFIIAKLKGVDPRQHGSGNIGATNIGRIFGRKYFWYVFILDALKSLVPMLVGSWIVARQPASKIESQTYFLWVFVGVTAVLGHMFSVFMKFKGGKGVSTAAGVILGLYPYFTFPGVFTIATFLLVFFIWKYVSLGSIIGVGSFPFWCVAFSKYFGWPLFGSQKPLLIFAVLIPSLIIYLHKGNIRRLIAGTEQKAGASKSPNVQNEIASAELKT